MTDEPTPKEIHDAAIRLVGADPSNTDPYNLTAALDPDDDIYNTLDPTPAPAPKPAEDGTTGDQS